MVLQTDSRCSQELGYPEEVVVGGGEGEHPADARQAAMSISFMFGQPLLPTAWRSEAVGDTPGWPRAQSLFSGAPERSKAAFLQKMNTCS
ncbi:MAG: hypothetical protein MJA83_01265 [Gammaproteobacteria bacterium]|nr:hypothetical protein [Gammaproteobacteria bacterium]